MKLIHLGDLHLGKSLGEYDLAEDQRYILKQILQLIKKESVDAVLIAGDVYDKAVPSESATRLLDEFLCELAELGVKTFIISGNHDSDDRLNYGSELFQKNKIFISAVYQGELYHRTLMDEYGEVNVWLLPFVKASQVRHFFPDKNIRDYETAVRTVLETAGVDKSRRNILVAHQFVAGKGMDPDCAGSETAAGAHNIGIVADLTWRRTDFDQCDMIFLPGGMPGTMHLKEHAGLAEQIREFDRQGKWLAAICAAPSVFGGLGILEGKKAICFPGFEKYLTGADITPERVVLDGHIFTSKGMGTAIDLGLAIVKEISGEEVSEELAKSIQYR